MSPKAKHIAPSSKSKAPQFLGRDGLGAYTYDPTAFPTSRVIFFDDKYVAINDLYPKSSVHTLLLVRSERNLLHPYDAFEDAEFLAGVQKETARLKSLVAKELRRRYGKFSAQEKAREAWLNGDIAVATGEELPAGRDWEKDVMVGIHAHPSMAHLHVHVLSVDRYSDCLRHRKHYNSFSTPFLVDVAHFPLARDDPRRHPSGYLDSDLICWRCGKNFGKSFAKLKPHLTEEYEKWKME